MTLRRRLLLRDECLLDVTTVDAPQAKTVDWLLHANADALVLDEVPSAVVAEPLSRSAGYEHFTDVVRWTPSQDKRMTLTAGSRRLRVWLLSHVPETIYSARCPGYTLEPRIPCLVRRVSGGQATLAAIYDWSAGEQAITAVRWTDDGGIQVQQSGAAKVFRF